MPTDHGTAGPSPETPAVPIASPWLVAALSGGYLLQACAAGAAYRKPAGKAPCPYLPIATMCIF
jgi:hypothetical protein